MPAKGSKLGFNETWSMAVGGMVGGGIFSTLGVVVGIAGAWAWLSFAAAGLMALASGYSYAKLAIHYDEGGGAFTFLRKINADGLAGWGLAQWDPPMLSRGGPDAGIGAALFGRPALLSHVRTQDRHR